jgi:hypothetical protein
VAEQLRPDVIGALTRPARLTGDRADALLDATDHERALAARVLLEQAAEQLADAGILRPGRTILDMTLREAQAIAAALGRLNRWWPQPALARHTLGDVLKVVPTEEAAFVVAVLRWAGYLPPTAEPDQEGPG